MRRPQLSAPPCPISVTGIKRFLGASFSIIFKVPVTPDTEWLRSRVAEIADKAIRLFAHPGSDSIGIMRSQMEGDYATAGIPKAHAPYMQGLLGL